MNTFMEYDEDSYDEDEVFVEAEYGLITAKGAEYLVEMFNSDAEPDERIWSRAAMERFVIWSGDVRLVWFDHKFTLNEMRVVGIDIEGCDDRVIYIRQGLYFEQVGSLVFSTAGRCTVRVPFVSDVPLKTKEWLV